MKHALLILIFSATAFASNNTIVLLPLDNVAGEEAVATELAPLITKAAEAKGWKVVAGPEIETLLEEKRVRYLDSLEKDVRDAVLEKSGANAILMVTVYKYAQSRNSTVALSAHLVDADGMTTWANITGVAASDTERPFGLDKKESVHDVAIEAINTLMRTFPDGGHAPRLSHLRSQKRGGAESFASPDLVRSQRICVLPFDNASSVSNATRVLADSLTIRLLASGFNVVDAAELRAAALQAGVSFHEIGSQDMVAIAKIVGAPSFLRGTIYSYNESGATPQIEVEGTLVDVAAGRVLWAAQDNRKGTDYVGFLMLGAVSNSISLTDRVAAELIATARTKHENSNRSVDRAALASSRSKGRQQLAGAGEGQR